MTEGDIDLLKKVLTEELGVSDRDAEALAHALVTMTYAMSPPSPDDGTLCRVCKAVVSLLLG